MPSLYEEYSPWKGAHFMDRLAAIKKGGKCAPVSLQISLTNRCCAKCYYCYVENSNKFKVDIDTEKLFKVLEEAKEMGVKAIEITGGGEPLVHPDVWKIISKINELGLDLGLITNGIMLDPEKLGKATWVRISLDSFNPATYKKIKGVNMPDMKLIGKMCKNKNVTVGASCVITPYNYKELYSFAKKAKEMGFSNVCFKPVEVENRKVLNRFEKIVKEQMDKAIKLTDNNFKVFSLELRRNDNTEAKPFPLCIQQHLAAFIWSNGDIYSCCSLQGNKNMVVGNIYKGSFKDQWFSRKIIGIKDCKIECFFAGKNSFLNYLVGDNPKHVNFM